MQQRQLRLGDILDDYCPRERRLTNHAVVAMVGDVVQQTRCTTCDAEHAYKHAKVPRQRRKGDEPAALYSQVLAGGPKRVTPERPAAPAPEADEADEPDSGVRATESHASILVSSAPAVVLVTEVEVVDQGQVVDGEELGEVENGRKDVEDGPVHRPLIRATLPRQDGQAPPARPAPDFTIRQPAGRTNRFRGRNPRGGQGQVFQGNRSNGPIGGGPGRGGPPRQSGGRSPQGTSSSRPHTGRKRSK